VTSTDKSEILGNVSEQITEELALFRTKLDTQFAAADDDEVWSNAVDCIWSFSRNGTNVLLNGVEGYERPTLWSGLDGRECRSVGSLREYDSAVVSGFQIATQSGPLCEEPMMGVCFIVEKWAFTENSQPTEVKLVNRVSYNLSTFGEPCRLGLRDRNVGKSLAVRRLSKFAIFPASVEFCIILSRVYR